MHDKPSAIEEDVAQMVNTMTIFASPASVSRAIYELGAELEVFGVWKMFPHLFNEEAKNACKGL